MKKTTFVIFLLGLFVFPNICMAALPFQSIAPVESSLKSGWEKVPQDAASKIQIHLKQEMCRFEQQTDDSLSSSIIDGGLSLNVSTYDTRFKSGNSWFSLSLHSVGRAGVMLNSAEPTLNPDGTKLSLIRKGMTEWYVNHGASLEHGMVLNDKPKGLGLLNIAFITSGNLTPKQDGHDIVFIGEDSMRYAGIKAWDVAGKDLICSMSVADGKLIWAVDDSDAAYPVTIDPTVTYVKKVTAISAGAGEPQEDAFFGHEVDISGNIIAISAYGKTVGTTIEAGAVYLFSKNQGGDNNWGFIKKITAADAGGDIELQSGMKFGERIALSGDTLVVACPVKNIGTNYESGAVYVFSKDQGHADEWGFSQRITNGAIFNGHFGNSVAVCGDVLVIGRKSQTVGGQVYAGIAYIYIPNPGVPNTWQLLKFITAQTEAGTPDYRRGASFSKSLAVSENAIIVSADNAEYGLSVAGAVYIYSKDAGSPNNWGIVKKIIARKDNGDVDVQSWSSYGESLDISGDLAIVGSPDYQIGAKRLAGVAYIYSKDKDGADEWGIVKKLVAQKDNGDEYIFKDAEFGKKVSISGDLAIVSSNFGAYLYSKSQADVGVWGIVKKIGESETEPSSALYSNVAICGDDYVIGSSGKTELTLANAGAAYIFKTPNVMKPSGCADKTVTPTEVQPTGTSVLMNSVAKRVKTTKEIKDEHQTPAMGSMLGANVYEFTATVTANKIAYFCFNSSSLGERAAGEVSLFKLFPDKPSKSFTYSSGKNPDSEGYFWITDEGNSGQYIDPKTILVGARTYTVNYAVKDNGEYDLNSALGIITDPVVPGTVGGASSSSSGSSGSSSGCVLNPQAGFSMELVGLFIVALIGLCLRRKTA
ncbi:FG-GAP repeat-containing protein [Maridesulfovibrio ferrireducens]|uniref:FG-GAP repeat-containing protein n=1 Tax=Maridesulfovibrio ferrireducens TaxID=246191 RepID=A0A1G9BA07_9BACT|nr:FG-GAP repeat protein [Maridesulfovibrio ferrireducens]SDK36347.1 FG-GAP repeat-containing protein [Maridesulfovibrio ferrireducens]